MRQPAMMDLNEPPWPEDGDRARGKAGLLLFAALCFLGSWWVAATLRVFDLNVAPPALGTRLFTTALLYALAMGWQPLMATWVVRRWVEAPQGVDLGLRPSTRQFMTAGWLGALLFAAAATLVAWCVEGMAAPAALDAAGVVDLEPPMGVPSGAQAAGVFLAFVGTLVLICLQAFTEEVGWRGYFLARAMDCFGATRGLLLQGLVWGVWYAPVLFFASFARQAPLASLGRSVVCVVTCVLLGTLLGWLRLASKSVAPVVVANTTLTLAAGLPYVLHGLDAGLRSAVLGPAGWLPLALGLVFLARSRWAMVLQLPAPLGMLAGPAPMLVVISKVQPQGHRCAGCGRVTLRRHIRGRCRGTPST